MSQEQSLTVAQVAQAIGAIGIHLGQARVAYINSGSESSDDRRKEIDGIQSELSQLCNKVSAEWGYKAGDKVYFAVWAIADEAVRVDQENWKTSR